MMDRSGDTVAPDSPLYEAILGAVGIDPATGEASGGDMPSRDEFERQLSRLLGTHPAYFVGGLHLIGLQKLGERLGDGWSKVQDKAQALANRIIGRHLLRGDASMPCGNNAFILVFPSLTSEQARVKCAAIAHEIAEQVLGREGVEDIDIKSVQVDPGGAVAVHEANPARAVAHALLDAFAEPEDSEEKAQDTDRSEWIATAQPDTAEILAKVAFNYRPMWHVRSNVISAYRCQPWRPWVDGKRLVGHDVVPRKAGTVGTCALDCASLRNVTEQLHAMFVDGRKAVLATSVHIDTFALIQTRTAYFSLCSQLPSKFRNYLVMEIVGVSDNVPANRLVEAVGTLKSVARSVLARTEVNCRDLAPLRAAGTHAIGVDIRDVPGGEPEALDFMNRYIELATKAGTKTFLHSLDTMSLATAAVCSGYDYVDGEAIASLVGEPRRLRRFGTSDLVARQLPR
jgi:hypothetical protein